MGTDANLNLVDGGEISSRRAMELRAVRDVLRQHHYDHTSPAATIATIIEAKIEYNRTRSHRHGGRSL